MKKKLLAAALALLAIGAASTASAQDYRRGGGDHWRQRADITVRTNNGRQFSFERGDRLFYRLLDRPFSFRPGMTYAYTDRCNRNGCIVFVFNGGRRPIDRIFAPHLPHRNYAWRQDARFDRDYSRFGRYDRDDRAWSNDDDRNYRDGRGGDAEPRDRRDDDRRSQRGGGLDGGPNRQ